MRVVVKLPKGETIEREFAGQVGDAKPDWGWLFPDVPEWCEYASIDGDVITMRVVKGSEDEARAAFA